jgi:hypothetical protein
MYISKKKSAKDGHNITVIQKIQFDKKMTSDG